MKASQLLGTSALEVWMRERGSSVLEAPRPPNSLLSINAAVRPLGLRFPPTLGGRRRGRLLQGKKNTTKQMQRELQVNVCVHVCVLRICVPVDS